MSQSDSPPLVYHTGTPTAIGVYACRVPVDNVPDLLEDRFLMWYDRQWSYLGSSQRYRGEILGWLGPLPRTKRQS